MDDYKISSIVFFMGIIILVLLGFRLMIVGLEDTVHRNNMFCKIQYNLTERGSDKFLGKYCAEVDYNNYNVGRIYYTQEHMMQVCPSIKYFHLSQWNIECERRNLNQRSKK